MSQNLSQSEVSEHNTVEKGLYIIIDGSVYDMTGFIDEHPGGSKILKRVGGKDASKQFWKYHNKNILQKYQERLKIGTLREKAKM